MPGTADQGIADEGIGGRDAGDSGILVDQRTADRAPTGPDLTLRCSGNRDCGDAGTCDLDAGVCRECNANTDCEPVRNGTPACGGGTCGIGACDPGYRDCNNSAG